MNSFDSAWTPWCCDNKDNSCLEDMSSHVWKKMWRHFHCSTKKIQVGCIVKVLERSRVYGSFLCLLGTWNDRSSHDPRTGLLSFHVKKPSEKTQGNDRAGEIQHTTRNNNTDTFAPVENSKRNLIPKQNHHLENSKICHYQHQLGKFHCFSIPSGIQHQLSSSSANLVRDTCGSRRLGLMQSLRIE